MKENDLKNLIEGIKQMKAIQNGTMKPGRVIKYSPSEVKKIRAKFYKSSLMTYKGYCGSVHYSDEDRCLYGKIEHIRSLVSYEGRGVSSIRKAFKNAVIDYLATCKTMKIIPDKPLKSTKM